MMRFYQLRGLVLLPVANSTNIPNLQNEIMMDNIFTPEHRQGRLVELSAAVRFFARYSLYKDNGEIPQRMAGRQRLINIARRHGVNNIGSLNLIIRKDS